LAITANNITNILILTYCQEERIHKIIYTAEESRLTPFFRTF
jgi:hypothetical protein